MAFQSETAQSFMLCYLHCRHTCGLQAVWRTCLAGQGLRRHQEDQIAVASMLGPACPVTADPVLLVVTRICSSNTAVYDVGCEPRRLLCVCCMFHLQLVLPFRANGSMIHQSMLEGFVLALFEVHWREAHFEL